MTESLIGELQMARMVISLLDNLVDDLVIDQDSERIEIHSSMAVYSQLQQLRDAAAGVASYYDDVLRDARREVV